MSLDLLWRELERVDSSTIADVLVRRVDPDAVDSLFLGIRGTSGTRLLILRLPSQPRLARHALVQSLGFRTTVTRFETDPSDSSSVVIETKDRAFNALFADLAAQVVSRLRGRQPHESAAQAFLACLHDWKRFFDSGAAEGLSGSRALGLFGELVFLRDFALRHVPTALGALAAWVGPDPLSKDFQFSTCAVEVKATSSSEPSKVHIADERQLDDRGFPSLFLFVTLVERSAVAGASLPELIDELRLTLADSRALVLFEDKLRACGYHDVHREQYPDHFLIRAHLIFQVRTGFPRLIGVLPAGVGDVSYTVTLAACTPFQVAEAEIANLLRSAAGYDA